MLPRLRLDGFIGGHYEQYEIDRDPAALFFFESVRVRAGEGLDECRFAMIDVTCRTDDDAFQSWSHRRSRARPRAAQTGMLLERQGRVKPARRGVVIPRRQVRRGWPALPPGDRPPQELGGLR